MLGKKGKTGPGGRVVVAERPGTELAGRLGVGGIDERKQEGRMGCDYRVYTDNRVAPFNVQLSLNDYP